MKNQNTYCVIFNKNTKNYTYIIGAKSGNSICLVMEYNSIGGTYYGTMVNSFISTIRGFLREFPDFLENIDETKPEDWLKQNGFEKTKPTELEFRLYGL